MSTEKEYEQCFNQWVKVQENCIEQIKYNIQNSKNMVKVHQEALVLQEKALKHEKTLLSKAIKNHEGQ